MATLYLFNSRSRKKESFTATHGHVGMYVCGITPYSVTHLGHAFTYTFFDVLARFLRHEGFETTMVQNLTDIDDDIIKRAKEEKRHWRELGEANTQQFLDDFFWLNNVQPDIYPRASDHIREIIAFTEKLLHRGIAYERNGNVYFRVRAYRHYGALSRVPKAKMLAIANERGNHPDDPHKEDPLDFVLWQRGKYREPSWRSPWGAGRPGWHIECSAMATKYLGKTIDIHGGGGDLIFPHHESEEAQTQAACGLPLARYWAHTAMLAYKGKKMSKSLGNLVLVQDLKKRYRANTVRLYLLAHHYRSPFEFFERDVRKAEQMESRFVRVWRAQSSLGRPLDIAPYRSAFYRAMRDDIQTPKALAALDAMARVALQESGRKDITDAKAFLNTAFGILGLRLAFRS